LILAVVGIAVPLINAYLETRKQAA